MERLWTDQMVIPNAAFTLSPARNPFWDQYSLAVHLIMLQVSPPIHPQRVSAVLHYFKGDSPRVIAYYTAMSRKQIRDGMVQFERTCFFHFLYEYEQVVHHNGITYTQDPLLPLADVSPANQDGGMFGSHEFAAAHFIRDA